MNKIKVATIYIEKKNNANYYNAFVYYTEIG